MNSRYSFHGLYFNFDSLSCSLLTKFGLTITTISLLRKDIFSSGRAYAYP